MTRFRNLEMVAVILGALATIACGPTTTPAPTDSFVVPEGCQPLAPEVSCTLPFPSDFFRSEDGSVHTTGAAVIVPRRGAPVDLLGAFPTDGASRQPLLVAALPAAIIDAGLPNITDDPAGSTRPESATVVLDAETGALVAHYTDIDPRSAAEPFPVLLIRPFAQLEAQRRYIVALHGVQTAEGPAPPGKGFARLRDGDVPAALASTAERFERDVFPILERAGIARMDLQLAWEFTTGSVDAPTEDLFRMQELTEAWLAAHDPVITITEVVENDDDVWRWVRGTVAAPRFMNDEAPSRLHRDESGALAENGETTFAFLALVPVSVRDRHEPGRVIGFGHGFFGSIESAFAAPDSRRVANVLDAVLIGTDFQGFSTDDFATLVGLTSDLTAALSIVDQAHQGLAQWLVLQHVIPRLAELEAFRRPASGEGTSVDAEGRSNAGDPLFATSPPRYFGASTSAIFGATLAAVSPAMDRVVLQVGGGAFAHMFLRSAPFAALDLLLDGAFPQPVDRCAVLSMLTAPLDRVDPTSYAAGLLDGEVMSDRRVLVQLVRGDVAVPNAASYLHARAAGLSMTTPSPVTVEGIPLQDASMLRSGVTVFDYGFDPVEARRAAPPTDNGGHLAIRESPAALRQIDEFLRDEALIAHPCDGVCDPE